MKNKLQALLALALLVMATAASAYNTNQPITSQSAVAINVSRGDSGAVVVNITNPTRHIFTNTITVAQDTIYDSVGGTNLVWLRPSISTLILQGSTNATGYSTNLTLTAYTAGWTVSNQSAAATVTFAGTNKLGASDPAGVWSQVLPVVVGAVNVYSPTKTNVWPNLDGTTNKVIVIQRGDGSQYIQWFQPNTP